MNRRELSALLPIAMLSLLCPRCALARPRARGCVRGAAQGGVSLPTLLRSSGRTDLDDACFREVANLNRAFDIKVAFGFYDDSDGENALAINSIYDRAFMDGTVLFGKGLASRIYGNGSSPIPLIGVMGHEWGHIRQFKDGTQAAWDVHYELSADYLSGWYLSRSEPVIDTTRDSAMRVFHELGDTDYTSEQHHGTPSQRSKMFSAAYVSSQATAREALELSLSLFN